MRAGDIDESHKSTRATPVDARVRSTPGSWACKGDKRVAHELPVFLLAHLSSTSLLKPRTSIVCRFERLHSPDSCTTYSKHIEFVQPSLLCWSRMATRFVRFPLDRQKLALPVPSVTPRPHFSEHRHCTVAEDHGEDAASQNAELSVVSCREDHQDQLRL